MKNIRHAGIVVSDLDRSINFYRDLLGLKIMKQKDESSKYIDDICALKKAGITTVKMAADDGGLIELVYFHPSSHRALRPKKFNKIGSSHVAFTVDDVAKEYERLSKAAVPFNSKPKTSPDGYAKVAFCKDPDGVFIELVEVLGK